MPANVCTATYAVSRSWAGLSRASSPATKRSSIGKLTWKPPESTRSRTPRTAVAACARGMAYSISVKRTSRGLAKTRSERSTRGWDPATRDTRQREGRDAAQGDRRDDAEGAQADPGRAPCIGIVLRRAAHHLALARDQLDLDGLRGDVAQAGAGAVRRGGHRAGDGLDVDVAEVLQGQAVLGQARVQLVDRDPRLNPYQPARAVDVEHARHAAQAQERPVRGHELRERVSRAGHADPATSVTGTSHGVDHLVDRPRVHDLRRGAAQLTRPVAPHGLSLPPLRPLPPPTH